jgi:hypothetical protein
VLHRPVWLLCDHEQVVSYQLLCNAN